MTTKSTRSPRDTQRYSVTGRVGKRWRLLAAATALVMLLIATISYLTSRDVSQPSVDSAIESSVQEVVAKYNSGDWDGLKTLTCGDAAARLLSSDAQDY